MLWVEFEPKISARERPVTARLLRSWVRIPPGAWIFVCCECRVLSGRGLCDELITRPEESYRLCCGVVCDLETSRMGAPYVYDISRLRVNMKLTLLVYGVIVSSGFIWSRTETNGRFLRPRIITVRMGIIMHLLTKQTVHFFFKKVAVSCSYILRNISPS